MQIDHTTLIKERLSITDVVGSYVKLEKAGNTFKACCPFHTEKTPSFFVVPDKNIYHCFGCGKGGDIFTFVQEIEGVEFRDAMRLLAERAGISLTAQAGKEKGKYDRLYQVLELATRFYEVQLRKDPEVVEYLLSRGLTKDTIKTFRIGYVSDAWRSLSDRLQATGVTEDELVVTGLCIKKEQRSFDRFRNRIMFPLMDGQGRVIGFSGRIFDPRSNGNDVAKYMNSPETVLYHKGSMLYAYDKAKKAMRDANQCLLVEGQFDVVLAHQAGTAYTVALSGTGLTKDHCALIKRFTDTLILALDGDDAGLRASRRSVLLALREGLNVSILPLPAHDDPASIIARDESVWHELVKSNVQPVFDLECSLLAKTPESEQRTFVYEHIFPLVLAQQSSIVQDKSLGTVAYVLGVSVDALRKEFEVWARDNQDLFVGNPATTVPQKQQTSIEETFVGLVQLLAEKYPAHYSEMERSFTTFAGEGEFAKLLGRYQQRLSELSFIAEHTYGDDEQHLEKVSKELLLSIEQQILERTLQQLHTKVHQAEKEKDETVLKNVLQELASVTNRLHELRHQRSNY